MQSSESQSTPSTPVNREGGLSLDSEQAQRFLREHFDANATGTEPIGAGAWSRAFGFRVDGKALVARFGHHLDDFVKDRWACALHAPGLPVPQVYAIGRAFDGYYVISTRCYGEFLDHLQPEQWQAAIPSVVDALEAMRLSDLSASSGWGGWGEDGNAPHAKWSEHLLRVADDTPDRRNYGWRARLAATAPEDDAIFDWGYERLQRLVPVIDTHTPRSLYHADLMNRNVLVEGDSISGVFDWGCSCYGDHLYDLAWFEFWAPWYPHLDIAGLRSALEGRWRDVGYRPAHRAERLAACYLHIGLDHLAYNAWLRDWPTLSATAQQMRSLVENL